VSAELQMQVLICCLNTVGARFSVALLLCLWLFPSSGVFFSSTCLHSDALWEPHQATVLLQLHKKSVDSNSYVIYITIVTGK
jgi:hypothetical protein